MTKTGRDYGFIDAWVQPAEPGLSGRPEFRRLLKSVGREKLCDGEDVSALIADMDEGGVEKALLTAWHSDEGALVSNDRIAELAARYPGRLYGAAGVPLNEPMAAVRELERAVRELGFVALRIMPWLWGLPPNDRRYYPLYAKCVELDVPFCLQVGHAGPLRASEPGRPIPYLEDVALDFPELRIVAGHIGFPWTDEMLSLAWKYENVYIDASAHPPRHYPPSFQVFMRTAGRDKTLFASDYPLLSPARCAKQALELGLPADVEKKFMRDTAMKLFKFDAAR